MKTGLSDTAGHSLLRQSFDLHTFLPIKCSLMPDHPSPSGLISRVVQNVKIYE
jgi:hypothetical protein